MTNVAHRSIDYTVDPGTALARRPTPDARYHVRHPAGPVTGPGRPSSPCETRPHRPGGWFIVLMAAYICHGLLAKILVVSKQHTHKNSRRRKSHSHRSPSALDTQLKTAQDSSLANFPHAVKSSICNVTRSSSIFPSWQASFSHMILSAMAVSASSTMRIGREALCFEIACM